MHRGRARWPLRLCSYRILPDTLPLNLALPWLPCHDKGMQSFPWAWVRGWLPGAGLCHGS